MRFWVVAGFLALGLIAVSGCGSGRATPQADAQPFRGVRLVVGAVGDPAILQTVAAQRGEWQVTHGAEVTIFEKPVDPKSVGGVDVLLFPGDRLGDLVDASALVPLPDSLVHPAARSEAEATSDAAPSEPRPDPIQFNDVLPAFRDQMTKYGMNDRLALPFGGTALVLVYRREAMEDEGNRIAAKEAGLALAPPRTWSELDALARFFSNRDWDGDGKPESGIALALGADAEGVGEATYLARAASLGQHPFHYSFLFDSDTMQPRITTPPFVEALTGLVALKQFGPPGAEGFDAEAARRAFRAGDVALLVDRAELAARWADPKQSMKIGVASLPGSERVYEPVRKEWETPSQTNRPTYLPRGGGWLVGVAAASTGRQRDAALDFISYLARPDTSRRILADRAFPMLPVRSSQLGQGLLDPRTAPGVDARQWSRALTETLTAAQVVPGLRIPDAGGYLADLANGRAAAINGEPAENALQKVSQAWADRTERLGRERQLWHYRRSLNTLTTPAEPPAR